MREPWEQVFKKAKGLEKWPGFPEEFTSGEGLGRTVLCSSLEHGFTVSLLRRCIYNTFLIVAVGPMYICFSMMYARECKLSSTLQTRGDCSY